jgi:hypothetical protein
MKSFVHVASKKEKAPPKRGQWRIPKSSLLWVLVALLAATTLLATLAALSALTGLRGLLTGLLLSAALAALLAALVLLLSHGESPRLICS